MTANIQISKKQARDFAVLIASEIAEFVQANRAAFEEFVREETMAEERGDL